MWSILATALAHGSILATALAHGNDEHPPRSLRRTTTIPDFYHNPSAIISELRGLCSHVDHFHCFEDRSIPYVVVDGVDGSVHDVMFAGMHAREVVASETALALIRRLSDPTDKPPHNLIIVPIQNIPMMKRVWSGEFDLRKNSNGGTRLTRAPPTLLTVLRVFFFFCLPVDLNRQGTTAGSEACEHEYPYAGQRDPYKEAKSQRGKGPMSEPESQMLLHVLRKFAPIRVALNTHSGEHSVYYPYDAAYGVPVPHEDAYNEKIQRVVRHHLCPECEREHHFGSASMHSSYQAFCESKAQSPPIAPRPQTRNASTGTVSDYIVFHNLAEFAFTLEVYGRYDTNSIFAMFNPTSQREYDNCMKDWTAKGGTIDALLSDSESTS